MHLLGGKAVILLMFLFLAATFFSMLNTPKQNKKHKWTLPNEEGGKTTTSPTLSGLEESISERGMLGDTFSPTHFY